MTVPAESLWKRHREGMKNIHLSGKTSLAARLSPLHLFIEAPLPERRTESQRDQVSHVFRPSCQSTQAGAKFLYLLKALEKAGFNITPRKTGAFVADGAGLSSRSALDCGFISQLVFSTLVDPVKGVNSSSADLLPLALMEWKQRVLFGDRFLRGVTDVLDPNFPAQFRCIAPGHKLSFIHCDAENAKWTTSGYCYTMVRNLCLIARQQNRVDMTIVAKIYLSEGLASIVIPLCQMTFLRVAVVRLSASNPTGAEAYLCMDNYFHSSVPLPEYPDISKEYHSSCVKSYALGAVVGSLSTCKEMTWQVSEAMDNILRKRYCEYQPGYFSLSLSRINPDLLFVPGDLKKKLISMLTEAQSHMRFDILTDKLRRERAEVDEYHRFHLIQVFYGFVTVIASEMTFRNFNKVANLLLTCQILVRPVDCKCGALKLGFFAGADVSLPRARREIRIYPMLDIKVRKLAFVSVGDVFRAVRLSNDRDIDTVSTIDLDSQFYVEVPHVCPHKMTMVKDTLLPSNHGLPRPTR